MENIKNITRFLVMALTILVFATGCEIQENFDYKPSGVDGKLDMTAWEYIQQNDSLSILRNAIAYADLEDLYAATDDMRTFIIPNNAAFRVYLKANAYGSVEDIPLPILRNMIRYHVVNDRVIFTDPDLMPANRPIAYTTENGQMMYLSHASNFVGIINEGTSTQWQIRTSNLEPLNGVIHVVNSIVHFSVPVGDTNTPNPDLVLDTIYPIHDAFVNGGNALATANYGSDPLLKVKNVAGNGEYDRKAFLMFDLDQFTKEGVVTDLRFQIAVSFTHAKGVALNLFETPSTTWSESSLNFSNAVFPTGGPIASITTTKVSAFNFDITDFFKSRETKSGRVSFMLDGQPGSDETDDLASKEHRTLQPPMLIATLAAGNSNLELLTKNDISVDRGGVFVFSNDVLEVSGAAAADIIYTVDSAPKNGWLIRGASTLREGTKFTQLDIELMNLLFIHDGVNSGPDGLVLSARDRAGALLDGIELKINVN